MLDHQRRANYVTHTVLDDYGFAVQLADAGCLYPVHRDYVWEPGELADNVSRTHIKQYAMVEYKTLKERIRKFKGDPRLLHIVNTEQSMTDARLRMYVELMHLSATDADGVIGFVFANEASGSEAHGYWVDGHDGHEYVHGRNVWQRPARIEYLRTLHQYRDLKLSTGARAFLDGEHCYTYRYVNFAVNGGAHKGAGHHRDWLDQDIEIDWSLPQDHLGRKFQAQYHALGWEWDRISKTWKPSPDRSQVMVGDEWVLPPYKIITEQLIDNMDGGGAGAVVDEGLIFCCGYTKAWGYNSMRLSWERWYPEYEPGEVLARMTEWAWAKIYAPTGYYIGGHTFSCGDTKSQHEPPREGEGWTPHNVIRPDGAPDQPYFDYMENQHLKVEYQEGLPIVVNSVPLTIDMAQYICGRPGRGHILSSSELCMTLFDAQDNRRFLFAKNINTEEMAVYAHTDGIEYIWRGWDTSRNAEELYFLTEAGKPGSRWCPRFWRVGQQFQRNCLVTVQSKSTCNVKEVYVDKTFLKLVKHHEAYRFPSGITLPDVIELTWYYRPEDQSLERYWYAKGWGLVGWTNGAGEMKTWVVNLSPAGTPKPQTWCNVAPIIVPKGNSMPVYTSPKDDVIPTGFGVGVVAKITADRNWRNRPETDGVDMGDLSKGEIVTYYASTKTPANGLNWYWVKKSTGKAWWAADLVAPDSLFDAISVEPPPPPPSTEAPTLEELKGIFVTQAQLEELFRAYLQKAMTEAFAPKVTAGS
jgi:hypothetical protein